MTERTKKILFAVFFILFSLAMGYGLYWMFFRAALPGAKPTTTSLPSGQLPQAGTGTPQATSTSAGPGGLPTAGGVAAPVEEGAGAPTTPSKIHLLRDGVTQAISGSPDGNGARFYNPDDGRFYRVADDGTITLMGDKQFFNVNNVNWGNKTDQVILQFPDGSNVYYDFAKQQQVTLPSHWQDFNFAPDDSKVVSKSIGVDTSNRFLITAKPDGTEAKALESLDENANLTHSSWSPNGQVLAWSETGTPQPENGQEIILAGQHHENFPALMVPGRDFLPNWSPTGKDILYSVWNTDTGDRPTLWVSSGDTASIGANREPLKLNTWADKCAWASDTLLYCGVPQDLPEGAGLQRSDFATLPDDIYRVDLASGAATKMNLPDLTHAVRTPVVNKDGSKLIFTDAANGKLYSYDLK